MAGMRRDLRSRGNDFLLGGAGRGRALRRPGRRRADGRRRPRRAARRLGGGHLPLPGRRPARTRRATTASSTCRTRDVIDLAGLDADWERRATSPSPWSPAFSGAAGELTASTTPSATGPCSWPTTTATASPTSRWLPTATRRATATSCCDAGHRTRPAGRDPCSRCLSRSARRPFRTPQAEP